nr:peroxisomal 2,4-dienoyl-CoA reductase [(3E)-enoyl-CoA-producing]-like [Neodiprion pinetum]
MDFANKVALITGGAGGIGFQSAKELLRNGLKHVAILDLASSPGEELADKLNAEFGKGRAIFVSCDVTKANELEAAFAKTVNEFGGLDIVINNAGILNESKWELTIDINLIAVVRGTMLALQYMGKDKGGKGGVIVNTSSTYGVDPVAWSPAYAAAKAGVVGLSRSYGLSYHYDKTGVRVITMCPSFTETQLLSEADDSRLLLFEDAKVALNEINNGLMQKGDMQVENKIALVTGGARGIGFAYATELLRNGAAHVAILDLATSPGLEAANKLNVEFGDGRAIFIECDVTKDIEFKAAFVKVIEELGGLDIVINNAGIVNESQYDLTININLTAVVRGTILGLQHMGKDKGGKGGVIVNTSSIYGLDPGPWLPVYGATKHGVVGLSRSFGLPYHYEKTGVKVLAMCPSFTDTKLLNEVGDCTGPFVDKEAAMNDIKSQSLQKPENVGKALVDIISRGNSGSVWISEAGEPVAEIFIPDRFTLVASSRKQP